MGWIRAEPVKYSVAECKRRTCYVCTLRLRAPYKRQECAFSKVCFSPHAETELDWRLFFS